MAAEKLHDKVLEECNCDKYFNELIAIYSSLLTN